MYEVTDTSEDALTKEYIGEYTDTEIYVVIDNITISGYHFHLQVISSDVLFSLH